MDITLLSCTILFLITAIIYIILMYTLYMYKDKTPLKNKEAGFQENLAIL